ncbi:MAG: class I SAM-dependent methyltransferase [Balneola sp.]|nr:MAG: class I SAM-dependent methyltransferase [Balneola sp.]
MHDEAFLKEVAAQLRKPSGEFGTEVALAMNESNKTMNLATISALQIEEGNHILEIGMGNGFFVSQILEQADDLRYTGIDYSEDMVQLASSVNREYIEKGLAVFHTSPAQHLPVSEQSIDRLFTINTLYFWNDHTSILNEFRRVITLEGLLVISIRPENCLKEYPSTQFNFEYYTNEKVSSLLEDHGLAVQEIINKKEPETEVLGKVIIPEYSIIIASIKAT